MRICKNWADYEQDFHTHGKTTDFPPASEKELQGRIFGAYHSIKPPNGGDFPQED